MWCPMTRMPVEQRPGKALVVRPAQRAAEIAEQQRRLGCDGGCRRGEPGARWLQLCAQIARNVPERLAHPAALVEFLDERPPRPAIQSLRGPHAGSIWHGSQIELPA